MPAGDRALVRIAAVAAAALIVAPGSATGAVNLGALPESTPQDAGCSTSTVQIGVGAGVSYEVPAPGGVITAWAHQGDPDGNAGIGRLQIWRPAGGDSFTLVGRSELQAFAPTVRNDFAVQIPVLAGDLLGLRSATTEVACYAMTMLAGDVIRCCEIETTDPIPGQTRSLPDDDPNLRLNVAAVLEPDADADGFGDESQDGCAGDPSLQGACVDTTLLSIPKDKVKTKRRRARVRFSFEASEPGSTFECNLDGAGFEPCSSPSSERVKKGRHAFEVRAVSPGGVADSSPAADTWKVKRKRHSNRR